MIKKLFSPILIGLLFLGGFSIASADEQPNLSIHFFYSETCQFCAVEQKFLDKMQEKYPTLEIYRHNIADTNSAKTLLEMAKIFETEKYLGLVPQTFVGQEFFLGFDNKKEGLGAKIEQSIKTQLAQLPQENGSDDQTVRLPLVGKIDMAKHSLPSLAVILGVLDGFNVCSLGALVLILGLVLTLRSRKKIIIFGGTFILTTTLVYGLLIALWFKLFTLVVPYMRLMQFLIAALGLGGGVYFLKQFIKFRKYGPTCEANKSQRISSNFSLKLQQHLQDKKFWAIVGLILLFAAIITIVEFPCSAVVPVIFAGLLSKAHLPFALHIFYIVLYLFFYMLDEIIVFLIATFKMTVWLASGKFLTWITLLEAILLFALGVYYLIGAI